MALLVIFEPSLCVKGVDWPFLRDYQQQRVCTLLDPGRDPLGKGFHTIQGMIAIGSGGFWGKGFMQGTQSQLDFIPESTTDFVFAAYSEEFGLLGNIFLIGGFLVLVFRGLAIALKALPCLPVCWRAASPSFSSPMPLSTWAWSVVFFLWLGCPCLLSATEERPW